MTIKNIKKVLIKHIPKNGTIIIGLSGGADSVFLLDQCIKTQKTHPFKIIVAHINHNIRGKESEKDELFSKELANKNLLKFHIKKIRTKPKGNIEEEFRNIRYNFFEQLRIKYKADLILTAHHLNDNIETILLNLTRGCHLDGLQGIKTYDSKRHLLRPLLQTTKKEITDYLKKNKIKFRTDSSNKDINYSRNRIRLKVIPELKKINKNLEKTFLQNIKTYKSLKDLSYTQNQNWLSKNTINNEINLHSFLKLKKSTQKDILFYLYKETHSSSKGLSKDHINQIIELITKNKSGTKKEFGKNHFITINRNKETKEKYIQILKKKIKQVK